MNLAIVIGRFPPGVYGGAEIQAEQWARRLAGRHRVVVITRKESASDAARSRRDGFEIVRLRRSRIPLIRTVADLEAIGRAARSLDPRPDLILCFQTFISGFAGVRIQKRLSIPAVVWVRGEDEYRVPSVRTARLSIPVWDAAAAVIVQSVAIRNQVLDAVRRYRPSAGGRIASKVEVVPNGVEVPERGPSSDGPGVSITDSPFILSVGRLIPEKAMDVVVEAAVLEGRSLVIAGEGPERERLAARIAAAGGRVRLMGAIEREPLGSLYRAAEVVVLASRRGEGLPNAVLEAMAHGRPVIATPVGGVPDLIRNGENGLLVPPDDVAALRAALARIRTDPELAGVLGAGALRTAECHAWTKVLPRLETILERFIRA